MILATHGIVKNNSSAGNGALTTAWITATSETDTTIISALNTLETDLTTYGLTAKIKALYPMVGGTAAKHKFNFLDTAQYQATFNGGWTHSSTGALPNGTNAYASTGIKVSDFTTSSIGMGLYSRTNTDGLFCDLGTIDTLRYQILSSFIGYHYCAFPDVNVLQNGVAANTLGLISINRYSTTNRKVYQNGTLKHTATETMSSTPSNYDFKIGASGGPSTTWYSPRQNALTVFKLAMTDTDEANLYTAVQAFQTTLLRNV